MKKLSIVVVAVAGLGGVAVAQKAGGSAATPAPKAGSGSAAAAPKADAKADAKADTKSGPEWGKAPAEIAAMAKQMAGTWKCKGQGIGPDMKMADMTGTMKSGKLEMDNWWIHDTFDSTTAKSKYHFDSYVTYDPTSKTWHRAMIETGGGYSQGDSKGMEANKIDWELTSKGPMGDAMFRDHIDASDPKAGVKTWGEASMDKGKNWMKVYELTCKK